MYAKLPPGRERENLAQTITSSLVDQDLTKAINWAQNLPEGRARQNALSNLAPRWPRPIRKEQ